MDQRWCERKSNFKTQILETLVLASQNDDLLVICIWKTLLIKNTFITFHKYVSIVKV